MTASPSSAARAVHPGDRVSLRYTGTLDNGEVFDTNVASGGPPLTFTAGAGQVIPGFDAAVLGMRVGETKKFRLEPAEAYGERNPDFVQQVPREFFGDYPIVQGQQVGLQDNRGNQLVATVREIREADVTLDFNPRLAGEALTFDIVIEDIQGA